MIDDIPVFDPAGLRLDTLAIYYALTRIADALEKIATPNSEPVAPLPPNRPTRTPYRGGAVVDPGSLPDFKEGPGKRTEKGSD